jgi:hypothetical protein
MPVCGKERARTVRVPHRGADAVVIRRRQRSGVKAKRANGFLLARVEGDRPTRTTARAGMAAPVFRMKTQALGHVTLSDIIVMPITGLSEAGIGSRALPGKSAGFPAARELPLRGNRHVRTG